MTLHLEPSGKRTSVYSTQFQGGHQRLVSPLPNQMVVISPFCSWIMVVKNSLQHYDVTVDPRDLLIQKTSSLRHFVQLDICANFPHDSCVVRKNVICEVPLTLRSGLHLAQFGEISPLQRDRNAVCGFFWLYLTLSSTAGSFREEYDWLLIQLWACRRV